MPPPGAVQGRHPRRRWLVVGAALTFLLGAAGVVVVPNVLSASLNQNESAAIATLKNISSGQAQCQASGVIDTNNNGSGEYGFFGELSGSVTVRGSTARVSPPVLSTTFAEVVNSQIVRSGYVFQMYLPGKDRQGIAEDPAGGDVQNDNGVDASLAEVLWCCYAWPRDQGRSGKRSFFVNQSGDVLATNGAVAGYDGASLACPWEAAYKSCTSCTMDTGVAANTVGVDGNTWVVI